MIKQVFFLCSWATLIFAPIQAQFIPQNGQFGINSYSPQSMSPCAISCEARTVKQIPCFRSPNLLTPPTPQYELALSLECGCENQEIIGSLFATCLRNQFCSDADQLQQQYELRYSKQICTYWIEQLGPRIPRVLGAIGAGGIPPGLPGNFMNQFPPPGITGGIPPPLLGGPRPGIGGLPGIGGPGIGGPGMARPGMAGPGIAGPGLGGPGIGGSGIGGRRYNGASQLASGGLGFFSIFMAFWLL